MKSFEGPCLISGAIENRPLQEKWNLSETWQLFRFVCCTEFFAS